VTLLERYIRAREARLTRDFVADRQAATGEMEWGLEHLGLLDAGTDAANVESLLAFNRAVIDDSDRYFAPALDIVPDSEGLDGTFPSPVQSGSPLNDQAWCRVFIKDAARGTVIIVPHWNGSRREYYPLAEIFGMAGFSTIVTTLPHHDERRAPHTRFDTSMITASVGRTQHSVRQAVAEVRSLVRWAGRKFNGPTFVYGLSLGSAVAAIAAAHEPAIAGIVLVATAAHFADVVWGAEVTSHVQNAVAKRMGLPALRELWAPISPLTYVPLHAANAAPQFLIQAGLDEVMRPENAQILTDAYDSRHVRYTKRVLPCGHQTIGTFPFAYWQAGLSVRFLRNLIGSQ
jgi:pimeloyl-ACP methyl ester carboxylesterase